MTAYVASGMLFILPGSHIVNHLAVICRLCLPLRIDSPELFAGAKDGQLDIYFVDVEGGRGDLDCHPRG